MAGSSITVTHNEPAPSVGRIVCTCTADDTDGSFPTTALPAFDGQLLSISTNPGATGPTADYDVTVVDAESYDVLGGAGADRHTSNTERAAVTSGYVNRQDAYSIAIANNSVNDATTVVTLHYTNRV